MINGITKRGAGVLCHISSLPNKYGIGSLGKEAYEFVDLIAKYGAKYWQILPLQQTGYGDSPYQSVCCTSGNPYFIDVTELYKMNLIDDDELASAELPAGNVDYQSLYRERYALLRLAYSRFNAKDKDFLSFVESGEFEDYALFMSLKTRYGVCFNELPNAYKFRESLALSEFKKSVYKEEYLFWLFVQYLFKKQWLKLKAYANGKGIKIIGDIPLYVAYDSSDVWSHPEIFMLDEELKPTKVAGVPPDYFSKTGQLWGNPVYDWSELEKDNYAWWVNRVAKAGEYYDVIRIDHFRGLDRFYTIDSDAETAIEGEWVDGPKTKLFDAIKEKVDGVEIIAEDLGVMDDGVISLRDSTGFPGMKIIMFAFDSDETNDYLPQNITENSVTYTGTHDNDTALGFLEKMTDEEFVTFKHKLREALKYEGIYTPIVDRKDATFAMLLCAMYTRSNLVVIPVQDILALNNEARMNTPSTNSGNWQFRLEKMPSRNAMALFKNAVINSNR